MFEAIAAGQSADRPVTEFVASLSATALPMARNCAM